MGKLNISKNTRIRKCNHTQIAKAISETSGFQKFHQDDLSDFRSSEDLKFSEGTIYKEECEDAFFISIDLKSANFNSMKYYDESMVFNCNSWSELLKLFTDEIYFQKSKSFRQKIFWLLDAKKINVVEKYLISIIKNTLDPFLKDRNYYTNTDEVFICRHLKFRFLLKHL